MATQGKMNLTNANFGAKGWAVCIYMFFIFYLNTSMNSGWQNCLSYWEATYGWNVTSLLSLVSIAQLIGVLACFITGRLATKYSTRMLSLAWGTVVTVSCFVINLVHNMVLFGILECLAVMGQVVWAYTLNPIFVSTWFPKKKGIVMGITTIGVPLGAGTVAKLMNWIGSNWGLNYCLYLPGAIGLIGILFLLFVVRDTPEEAGCTPDNDTSLTSEDVKRMAAERAAQDAKSPWTVSRMLKQKETYIVALCIGCCALFGGGFMGTNVLRMLSMGVQIPVAVNLMMMTAAFACVASYFFGVVDGKFGPRIGIFLVQAFAVAACLLSALANGTGSFPCLIIGLMLGGCVIGGAANFKRAYGVIYPIHQIPGSMGTLVIAQISARAGYAVAYVVLAVILAVAAIILLSIKDGSFVEKAEASWK